MGSGKRLPTVQQAIDAEFSVIEGIIQGVRKLVEHDVTPVRYQIASVALVICTLRCLSSSRRQLLLQSQRTREKGARQILDKWLSSIDAQIEQLDATQFVREVFTYGYEPGSLTEQVYAGVLDAMAEAGMLQFTLKRDDEP